MRDLPAFTDPNLGKLYDTIRQLRQAQRRATKACVAKYHTLDEAQEALDDLACEGLYTGQRVTREDDAFTIA